MRGRSMLPVSAKSYRLAPRRPDICATSANTTVEAMQEADLAARQALGTDLQARLADVVAEQLQQQQQQQRHEAGLDDTIPQQESSAGQAAASAMSPAESDALLFQLDPSVATWRYYMRQAGSGGAPQQSS
ncbi:hypothetical protein HaLaN_16538, partial [Haematococcus lacustris]